MRNRYLMSSAQKRIFTIENLQKNSITYNIPLIFEIDGNISKTKLERAFQKLCNRYEVFRTWFTIEDEKFLQIIENEINVKMEFYQADKKDNNNLIKQFIRPFDLGQAPLLRMGLVNNNKNKSILMIDVHHIIFDGASTSVLMNDLNALYSEEILPELEIQYKDFAAWHNSIDFKIQKEFWNREFRNLEETTKGFPVDYSHGQVQTYSGKRLVSSLDNEVNILVDKICRQYKVTGFMLFISVLMILLMKYNNQNRSVVGTVVDGRNHPEAYDMIGMFVNSLPVIAEIAENDTFKDFLNNIKEKCFDVFDNQDIPFEQLVDIAGCTSVASQNPLFDIMFSYEKSLEDLILFEGCRLVSRPVYLDIAKFDLTLSVIQNNNGYVLDWEYNTRLYSKETIELINEHFKVLLLNLLKSPNELIWEISYISKKEQKRILEDFSQTTNVLTEKYGIIEIFESQVTKKPNKEALLFGKDHMTYRELNDSANYVGSQLRELGIKPNDVVALLASRSFEMIIGMIGILKAGAAYLPIDPQSPLDRIKYMFKNSNAKAVLNYQGQVKKNKLPELPFIELSRDKRQIENLPLINSSKDLAYIIYTSGTTGIPKGVMLEQNGLVNLIRWQMREAGINEQSVILQKSTYIFDASVWECFLALLTGSTLQLLSEKENNDFKLLIDKIIENRVTHTLMIPTVFDALLDYMLDEDRIYGLDSLKRIYLGAETVTNELINKYCKVTKRDKTALRNLYGPTEATVCATYYDLTQHENNKIPIGTPIDNVQIYIMNNLNICGIGVIGEIYIGGAGVAKGYVSNGDLTNEKFFESPFEKGHKLYATGDLGKWNHSGQIEFYGRKDDQVKIRGLRVELSEIETLIASVEKVDRVVVLVKEINKSKQLCAYFTSQIKMDIKELKKLLKKSLPTYMIPAYIVQIDKFPMTKNGKLDRKKLPEPAQDNSRVYVFPQTKMEKVLIDAVESVLEVSGIGMEDSFFELGGDSIKAIRIVSKIREKGYELSVPAIMKSVYFKNLAEQIKIEPSYAIEQTEVTGIVPYTPIQNYFYNSHMVSPHHFNQSFILECSEKVDRNILEDAIKSVIQHHDILRMVVKDGIQIIEPYDKYNSFKVEVFNVYEKDKAKIISEIYLKGKKAQQEINIENGSLVKALLFSADLKDYIWLIIHHLVVDGVSWRIIIEDINNAYLNKIRNNNISLPLKTTSYKEWSEKLQQYSKSYEIISEIPYWEKTNQIVQENKNMCFDLARANTFESCSIMLTDSETRALIYETARKYNVDMLDLLLTAVARSFYQIYDMNVVAVNLESHGREDIIETVKLDRTVGWFTSLYPVVIKNIGVSPDEDIQSVKETLRRVPNHGIGYGSRFFILKK